MAEGRGFELVGRWAGVISRRDTAAPSFSVLQ